MTGPDKTLHTDGRLSAPPSKLRDLSASFCLVSPFTPQGDQPGAISKLNAGLEQAARYQTLLGITGSGKTYTIANVIEKQNRPALVIAPNKTLAAQLYSEFREFFPENRVRYFVSYYDYYQPEAYLPATDTYIEKDSAINEEIDKMRHSATRALLEARDVIIVASVSCIYGLGAPEDYFKMMLFGEKGQTLARKEVVQQLVRMQYRRGDLSFERGHFRARGDTIDIFPSDEDSKAIRLQYFGDQIEEIKEIDSLSGTTLRKLSRFAVYPVSHFVTNEDAVKNGIKSIRKELYDWLPRLRNEGKVLEAQRLEQRTLYDLELLEEVGFCPGIENYSRHLSGRAEGSAPTTLIDYFPDDFLLIIDESHVTVPQLGAMYRGDRSRKQTLVNYGFRLPSAMDNRPLSSEEFWSRVGQTIFVSATPGEKELQWSKDYIVEQLNRPTGLLDPQIIVKPALNQIDDLLGEIKATIEKGDRILVTTLTKRTAEKIAEYLRTIGVKARYLHSDINAIERVELIRGLRSGEFDVLIGINLLREGLDLVEVSLVAILDADKEGFLRSTRSLIQTMGRAARHLNGRAILYADKVTDSMAEAMEVTQKRREIQTSFNQQHGITPASARRPLEPTLSNEEISEKAASLLNDLLKGEFPAKRGDQEKFIESLRKAMFKAAADKNFEKAAELRDAIGVLQKELLLS